MTLGFRQLTAVFIFGMASLWIPSCALAQQVPDRAPVTATVDAPGGEIPDAPAPQIELAFALDAQTGQAQSGQQPAAGAAPATNGTGQSQSAQQPAAGSDPAPAPGSDPPAAPGGALKNGAAQNTSQQPSTPESQRQKAAEQIKEQEHQRIAGVLPSFNVTYLSDAASMTAGQKISLAFRSAVDPYTFGIAFIVAGIDETHGDEAGFKWGPQGYFERSGAAYLDAFDGAMIGNGILPAVLHQDPRYFRLGHGSFHHRFFYAIATSYICKHDNTHRWEPNYSNVGGNIIAGAISNLYYPGSNSGWGQTITTGLVVTTEGTFGGVLQEFWPDISRRFLHKDPTHGLDAKARAADDAEKQKKKQKQDQDQKQN
jgi:hypothetical protein